MNDGYMKEASYLYSSLSWLRHADIHTVSAAECVGWLCDFVDFYLPFSNSILFFVTFHCEI